MAVFTPSRFAVARNPVFRAPRRQKRLYWPIFWPYPGCYSACRRHYADAAGAVLVCQCDVRAGLGADAAPRGRPRRRSRRPPDRVHKHDNSGVRRAYFDRYRRGGMGSFTRRPPETLRPLSATTCRRRCRAIADPRMCLDIRVDMRRQCFGAFHEEVVGALDLAIVDLDIALMRQLVHQFLD